MRGKAKLRLRVFLMRTANTCAELRLEEQVDARCGVGADASGLQSTPRELRAYLYTPDIISSEQSSKIPNDPSYFRERGVI
jgi:hypothetical protein